MNKQEFLQSLKSGLSSLPKSDLDERLAFYSEMIDDRMEEGLSEEQAVAQIGDVSKIITQTVSDTPLKDIVKQKIKKTRKLKVWEIVLLALGSPIWLSLAIAAFAVILSLYVSAWSVIISLWAVFCSFIGCSAGSIIAGIVFTFNSFWFSGIACFSAAFICAGLSIFMFFGCKGITKGIVFLTKKILIGIKMCFLKGEDAQ